MGEENTETLIYLKRANMKENILTKIARREGKFSLVISCHSARVSEEEEKFKSCRTKLRNSDVSAALVQLHLEYCVQLCFRLQKIGCFLNSDISKVLDNFKN